MGITADLQAVLKNDTAVAALIVTNTKTNTKAIRPDRLAQSDKITATLGAIEISTDGQDYANDLQSSSKTSLVKVLIDCIAQSSLVANAIADAVENALEPLQGATGGGTVKSVELVDRREEWATDDDGTDTGEYVAELELSVLYTRS